MSECKLTSFENKGGKKIDLDNDDLKKDQDTDIHHCKA